MDRTIKEFAKYLGASESTVYGYVLRYREELGDRIYKTTKCIWLTEAAQTYLRNLMYTPPATATNPEIRVQKMNVRNPGGNAGSEARQYRLSLPTKWLKIMGITPDERTVKLTFDGEKIIIHKAEDNA